MVMLVLAVLMGVSVLGAGGEGKFPPWFRFGAATSAHQIEGAWNISGKTPSMWDTFVHASRTINGDGDVACDSYHLWRQDVQVARDLGLDYYRFSLSWTRLLPSGYPDAVNPAGVRYYSELIDALLAHGIQPAVTLYHWDLPQSLIDLGGWTNPLIVEWFADYARVAFALFGARVRTWLTLNEPMIFCELSYAAGVHAPAVRSPGRGDYLCARHAMLAHARAWRIYDEEFRHLYNGRVSLTNQIIWIQAEDPADEELAEMARQADAGIYSHPIFSAAGGWPPALEKHLEAARNRTGYPPTVLPKFTKQEIKFIRGTFDFYGVNYYTSRYVERAGAGEAVGARPIDGVPELRAHLRHRPDWFADHPWFYIYPPGLRKLLNWIKAQYGDLEIQIFENGLMQRDKGLHDPLRVHAYKDHLEQVLLAMEDGVNVTAYTAWTMLDNFEWTDGYDYSFGLYHVDFSDPLRRRTPRSSARYFAHVIRNRTLDIPEDYRHYAAAAAGRTAVLPALLLIVMMIL
ncbi:cytosolic beta-glucosidase-like [Aricia agestis]|uniref:cytosolic beta-glucosidase-like n=1 Tax=Aricia agestis TaxID=91739 RepID=UPI001C209FB2|nr:cytosolic beta-glucosidase-like [Aricia agestis]